MIPKFRAFNQITKKMYSVEGFKTFELKIYRYSLADDEFRSGRLETFHFVEDNLDNYILMQSTGLFDKNGVEIWVGDILEVRDTSIFGGLYRGAVEYLDNWGVYGFNLFEAKVLSTNKFKEDSIGFLVKEFGNCFTLAEASSKSHYSYEIIGNIYQNPDLLESVEE